jgi:type I restriction enzyme R subunit
VKLGSERTAVQHPLAKYAADVGWTYLSREEAEHLRGGDDGLVLRDCLATQLERLNAGRVNRARAEELANRLTRVLPSLPGNLEAWEYLRGVKSIYIEEEKQERNVRFLDVENLESNRFHVTEEWSYRPRPDADAIRFDVVFVINGIPILAIETKAAHLKEGMGEALDQIRRYHEQGPEELALMQLFGITHILRFLYGATWNTSAKNIYNWREEASGNYEDLVKAFVDRERLLRVLLDFIVFATIEGELIKFVLRPHQMRAVDRVVGRSKDPSKNRGLVWHTQGSGKTYTMITAGRLLQADSALANPTVLVLVDRTELEGQMSGNLESLGLEDVRIAASKADLEAVLSSDWRGIVLSMLHKFDDMAANLCTRDNVIVLIDEAHRTMSGALGTYLMAALPNATFVGFTGTPIDKTAHGLGTFKVFGRDDPEGFLDKYSIRDSIEDGTTLPLNYALAANELLVDRETLEREFLQVAELEGVADVETLNKVLERAVTLRNIMKNAERVDAVARRIAEHYKENVEKSGYKAFVVAVDREACVLYKDALDKYLPAEYSDVIISPGHNDPPKLRRYHYDERREEDIRKAFRKPDALPKVLIVTEKLLTGFDAPILYCMYLDKPMRDHVLLQAIARVNRPYEDADGRAKQAGLIIDFVGIFSKLEEALAFDSQDVSGVVQGLDVLQRRFAELIAQARAEYLAIGKSLAGDKEVEAVVKHFRDEEERARFQEFISEVENLFEIISPDAFLRPYLDDYDALMRLAAVMRAAFYPGIDIGRSFQRKTAELVQRHTSASGIDLPTHVEKLTSAAVEAIVDSEETPDTVKVVNLVKLIHDIVANDKSTKPFLISIGERAERVAEAFRNGQASTEDALAEFREMVGEIQEADVAQKATGLDPQAFAVLWYLRGKGLGDEQVDLVAKAAAEAFSAYPNWRVASQQESDLRLRLYGAFLRAGIHNGETESVEDLLANLRTVRV